MTEMELLISEVKKQSDLIKDLIDEIRPKVVDIIGIKNACKILGLKGQTGAWTLNRLKERGLLSAANGNGRMYYREEVEQVRDSIKNGNLILPKRK